MADYHFNYVVRGLPKNPEKILENGIKLSRHSSKMGILVENSSVGYPFVILYEEYRKKLKFRLNDSQAGSSVDNRYIDGSNLGLPSIAKSPQVWKTTTELVYNEIVDPNTSKWNCDKWSKSSYAEAVNYCRSLSVDGKSCDLPNVNLAKIIYENASEIDKFEKQITGLSSTLYNETPIWTSTFYGVANNDSDFVLGIKKIRPSASFTEQNKKPVLYLCGGLGKLNTSYWGGVNNPDERSSTIHFSNKSGISLTAAFHENSNTNRFEYYFYIDNQIINYNVFPVLEII